MQNEETKPYEMLTCLLISLTINFTLILLCRFLKGTYDISIALTDITVVVYFLLSSYPYHYIISYRDCTCEIHACSLLESFVLEI